MTGQGCQKETPSQRELLEGKKSTSTQLLSNPGLKERGQKGLLERLKLDLHGGGILL